ncbi:single-stranded DNA-binding protein [Candidatus Vecturithrix granuli]|uniref:Single-stranded DNA-binding protein n=1 Tax=Vecturithrix granuli TaxID=1499967 RepID=A0A081BZQ6_VECG1|nr:single-stranded DNA-binding protein [Candidatus Vecturithrix granuli]
MAEKSLNKVQLIGRLGKDADLRYTPNGKAVASFSLATNERFKPGDSDEWQDKTEWHNIVVWGKTAESLAEYLTKGQRIYVDGRLQTRSWEDQSGNKRYTTEIVAWDVILLGGRGDSSSSSYRPPHPAETYTPPAPTHTGTVSDNHDVEPVEEPRDDIPF